MTRWQRYWCADGGRFAAGCVRIAIAISVLICLHKLGKPVSTGDLPGQHTLYRPIGIWMVFGHHAPPVGVVAALRVVAWVSTIAMLVGLYSRLATAISFASACSLAALAFSASHAWSHQYNVVLLAQLAFVGARSGDALAIDARRGGSRAGGYQWSLRLAQLAVALMFAGAALHKLAAGHFTLRWALSDNLRDQLLVRFDLANLARPPLVDWLLADPWRYKSAALLNLITQALPIVACVLVRRPKLRAIAGLAFVIETIALGFVVGLWNWQWLPLYAVFVDWDALFRIAPSAAVAPRRATRIWIAAFVAYALFTAVVPGVDQRLGTYPFSSFPMFGGILARPPYDEHRDFTIAGDHFEVTSDVPIDEATQRWFDHANRGMYAVRDPAELHKRLAVLFAQAQRRYPTFHIHRVRSELAFYVAPAYPAPAHFEVDPVAIVGEVGDDGSFRTRLGPLTPEHVATAGPKIAYLEDGDTIYVTAKAGDGTWLVASSGDDEW
ncbi:MAG TPA: hypothetical protein VGG28_10310 [Kofleriaceae bacterium]